MLPTLVFYTLLVVAYLAMPHGSDFTDLRSNPSPIRSRLYQTWTLLRTRRDRLVYLQ